MAGSRNDDRELTTEERFTAALEAIAGRMASVPKDNPDALNRLADAFEKLTSAQREIADGNTKTLRQIHKPSNDNPPLIGPFNLRGDKDFPRPQPKCKIITPWTVPHEMSLCTREEIELLNLLEPGEYLVRRTDGTRITLKVTGLKKLGSDEYDVITVNHPTAFKNEEQRLTPPLTDILRQMCKAKPHLHAQAQAVLTMDEEEALILAGKLNDGSIPADGVVVSRGA